MGEEECLQLPNDNKDGHDGHSQMRKTNQIEARSFRWMPTWTTTRIHFQRTQVPSPPSHSPDFIAPIRAARPPSQATSGLDFGTSFHESRFPVTEILVVQ